MTDQERVAELKNNFEENIQKCKYLLAIGNFVKTAQKAKRVTDTLDFRRNMSTGTSEFCEMTFSTSTGEALSILATKENEVVSENIEEVKEVASYYVELSNKLDIYYKNSFHRE